MSIKLQVGIASPDDPTRRYVGWVTRRWRAVTLGALVGVLASVCLIAVRLPLRADVANLLPEQAPSVRDLRTLERRVALYDSMAVLVHAVDPVRRAEASRAITDGLRALPVALVKEVRDDDAAERAFLLSHLHQYVPAAQLVEARDALRTLRAQLATRVNPLLVSLDDEPSAQDAEELESKLDELRGRWRELRDRLGRSGYLAGDLRRVMVRIAFDRTDTPRAAVLVRHIEALRARVEAAYPGVSIGVAGGVAVSVAEHDALVRGMAWSAAATAFLVGLVLVAFLRSLRLVALAGLTLAASTTVAFGIAAITVGQLNAATAFLGAIIAGNGVNYGILLLARYQEARAHAPSHEALAIAIRGTVRPTLVASLAAAVAYGSLAITSFRGFADFALIGGVGMLVCWIGAFVLLPALVVRFAPERPPASRTPLFGATLARVFGGLRPVTALAIAACVGLAATVIVIRYVAADPLAYDLGQLRSDGPAARTAARWMALSNQAFGPGLTSRTVLAVDDVAQVPALVDVVRGLERNVPPSGRVLGEVRSIIDVVPPDQATRRAVLDELRAFIDDPLVANLDDGVVAELRELRPPEGLGPIEADHLPGDLVGPLTERDGAIGRLIAIRPGPAFDERDGKLAIRFARTLRGVHDSAVGPVAISGSAVIFADMIDVIRRDGPRVTLLAAIGLVLVVLLVVGRDRRAVAVAAATSLGTVTMVATCALLGLKVNFLDFVALPITLGLGVDYAINLAHRQHADGGDPLGPLRTNGAAVLVCSLTTVIGYGSLLASQNLAIRDFGIAALIGEVTCLVAALVVVPALARGGGELVAERRRGRAPRPAPRSPRGL